MPDKFERGSEWRKWDLHVHTPKSIIQNYGGDTDEVWEKYIADLENLPKEFKVIGINDYIYLDGYRKILEYREKGRLQNFDLILPVIELRVDKFASIGDESWKKVNLHVIFSDENTPDEIQAQFLGAIQHSIRLSPDVEDYEISGIATKDVLEEIGQKIKETTDKKITGSDLKVGFWNVFFDYKSVVDIVLNGYFKKKCLVAIGKSEWDTMRWTGSAALKKSIINYSHFSFISLNSHTDYPKHSKALTNQNVRSFLLDCSDAHDFSTSTEKDRIGNSNTWLKADTTFKGLMQVANDHSRIFIGEKPDSLVRLENNPTKFIESLTIEKIQGSTESDVWFDSFSISINHSMVAIIGNKGNGKSAIADTLGLLGNTPNYTDFSFLNKRKFRRPKPSNKATQFEGKLKWCDGTIDTLLLSDNPLDNSIEKVKYIPQGYLEKLCNDDISDFEKELREVIFSHLSDSDKLGKETLDELVEFKTQFISSEIEILKQELFNKNKSIIELEDKTRENYISNLNQKLNVVKQEKNSHLKLKPKEVKPPTDPEEIKRNESTSKQLEQKRYEFKLLNNLLESKEKELKTNNLRKERLLRILQALEAFELQHRSLQKNTEADLKELNLNLSDIVKVELNKNVIQDIIAEVDKALTILKDEIENKETGLKTNTNKIVEEGKTLKEKLGETSKNYQKYLDNTNKWLKKQKEYDGAIQSPNSIKFFENQINFLKKGVFTELKSLYDQRKEILRSLFRKKSEIINLYKTLFNPLTNFIKEHSELLNNYQISIDVEFKVKGLIEKFFDHVSFGSKGSFIGNPDGVERLKGIFNKYDLNKEEDTIAFLDEVIDHLKFDKRKEFIDHKREIPKQLKKGYSTTDLYEFLFDLDFLEPEYRLKLADKNVSELSPGERGALLLIFYLTIDQNDIPLVIDQPEENLDNQSVFNILVQFIIKAKKRRQIIIVTHNPNLAVACNAEQIIQLLINKSNKNEVTKISGSLENENLNNAVIDVLEGTFPALKSRTRTYNIIKR